MTNIWAWKTQICLACMPMVTALAGTVHEYKKFLTELFTYLDSSLCGRTDFCHYPPQIPVGKEALNN